jgi:perosamine synthetase
MYRENLSDITEIEFVDIDLKTSVPWFSDILLPNEKIRQELIEHSNKFRIGTRKFYPPIHKLASYQNIEGDFEISDEISKRGLWLPSSSFLTDEEIMRVCDTIRNFWN